MPRVITPPKPPPLYPKQDAAINDPARFVCIEASTKSGKTAGCLSWVYRQAIAGNDRKGLWLEPTYTMAKDIGYARLVRMLLGVDPGKTIWESSDTALEIRLANGSLIRFKGGDNADGIYGEDYHFAVIDEATRCREDSWHAVRSTLTATRGPVRIIGNVRGRKNWAYQLGQRARSGEPNMAYHKLTAYDAVDGGVLDAAEVEDARRILPEVVFRELYLAEPSEDGNNPFGLDAIRRCAESPPAAGTPAVFGIDLGKYVDWTVLVGLDANGVESCVHRWRSDWEATERRILEIIGDTPTLVDATGSGDQTVERLQRRARNVSGFTFTAKSKQQLMEGLAAAIQTAEVRLSDPVLLDELESFEFQVTRTGVRYSAPDGMHDDCVCALALAVRHRSSGASTPVTFRVI